MPKVFSTITFLLFILLIIPSCKKTTENQLVNGLWNLNSVNLDTSSVNYLDNFPEFGGSCCGYKLSFQQNDILLGYYIANDSIKRLVSGTWTVTSYTEVTMKVDSFIDGTFTIDRTTLNHWQLTSNKNHIIAFDNGVNPQFDTCYTKLDMTR
jgi:hypothetical protein